ncbi:tyrosine-type recombinase/integrase [Enterococcus sp. DIV0187]|uniref:site-specific integrase n=1 Tax=Enterococcus sp. DIV0187 TaxID=2774644 RepID=UPI003F24E7EC
MATYRQYSKKDGTKAWMFRLYLGKDETTGKDKETTRRGFETKKEAQLACAKLKLDFEKDGLVKKTNKETFQDVYTLWLETYRTTVKEVTFIKTEIKFKKWILPHYGSLFIDKVTVKNAQKILNQWAKDTDQYRVLHSTAKRIFAYAVHLGLIQFNPLEHVMMPKRTRGNHTSDAIKVYSKEQIKILFDYLDTEPHTYSSDFNKVLLRFLFFSGCRVSEALALNWKDIDFDKKEVTISKTLSQTKNGYSISQPKTAGSNATVSLDDKTLSILKRWQIDQRKYMLSLGITDPSLVFCGIYKQIITHHSIYQRLKTITTNAELPFLGVHVTRHTHASILLDAGESMKAVQVRLRHSSIKMTMDTYGHLSKETKETTAEKFVEYVDL